MLMLRKQLEAAEEAHLNRLEQIRRDAWKNLYYNEMAVLLERYGLRNRGQSTAENTGRWFYLIAKDGCEQIMWFVAQIEGHGWEVDYEKMKFDGYSSIEVHIDMPTPISLNFYMFVSEHCRIVEEKTYEIQEKIIRKVICD